MSDERRDDDDEHDDRDQSGVIHIKLNFLQEVIKDIKDHYVTQEEFKPVKHVIYGLVGLILTGFIVGLLTLLLKTAGQ